MPCGATCLACLLRQRLPAALSPSCLSWPSCGMMNLGEGDHLGAPWRNEHRRDGRMRGAGLPLGGLPRETVGTRNGFGGKVSGASEGEQQLVLKNTTVGQPPLRYKAFQALKKHRIEGMRHAGIEKVASLIVPGNLGGIQQGADLVLSLGLLQMALILQT
jgi:hypothetical protein